MKPIYKPRGKAAEYGDYALNIYTGCPHRCTYCFAPAVLRKDKETFHSIVEPRKDIVAETQKQLATGDFEGKLIHLCFTCDPYPTGYDTTPTREIIKAIKNAGAHVQILTKGDGIRDFDLLYKNDWYGVTLTDWNDGIFRETGAIYHDKRISALFSAKKMGIKTWVSFEPVYNPEMVYMHIKESSIIDRFKIGKLNYAPSDINWGEFGRECERLCLECGRDYYIKDSLRKEMEK